MLTLQNIHKQYTAGSTTVDALKGVNLSFRKSEFVAILGPSGCGKTTLLNIIGGLDRYTSGDLRIDGRSTKHFGDRDWDTYRNHSIGFVFQSYNLIPHQTVLQNVELALTLSGVSRGERKRRAAEALEKVGLADQLHKKPNQMSGGQMQRVAIARALVNNPEILLADEPTGALDSATSVQIMELLKEISHEKLIIMVTHNPDLAEQYATRTVKLLDGQVISDSHPFTEEVAQPAPEKKKKRVKKEKKTSMSFFTALSLSLNNLMTKKARTFLTAFAGSIGIIGIALILALSEGIQTYIDAVQEDTLSTYPLTIQAENPDMSSLLATLTDIGSGKVDHEKDGVYPNAVMYDLLNSMNSIETDQNNLKPFKEFLEKGENGLADHISAIRYSYGQGLQIYVKDPEGKIVLSDLNDMITRMMGDKMQEGSQMMAQNPMSSMMAGSGMGGMQLWEEMLTGKDGEPINDLLYEQYDLVYGKWPEKYNEVVLVVDKNNEVPDISLYALGLKTADQLEEILENAAKGDTVTVDKNGWTYQQMCDLTFKMVLPADRYQKDAKSGNFVDMSKTEAGLSYLYDNGLDLHITGIIRPNEDAVASMMTGSIGYTAALTDYIAEKGKESAALKAQLENKDVDVFSGLPFRTEDTKDPTDNEKATDIKKYLASLSVAEKADIYAEIMATPTDAYVSAAVEQGMAGLTREKIETMMVQSYAQEMGIEQETIEKYIKDMDDATLFQNVRNMMGERVKQQYAEATTAQLANVPDAQLAMMLTGALPTYDTAMLVRLYDTYMPPTVSDSSYGENLKTLGHIDEQNPAAIHIYAATFADKDAISDAIASYNDTAAEEDVINYTDYVALMMSSITAIISAISYILIAFVAISLVVSSIMIGIITYISVLERTKEIGILRSIGASKKDVSRVFNAETLIVGFTAGAIGIGITLLLCIPINAIIQALTQIKDIGAILPWQAGVILVLISMVLTLVAGLFPAKVAANKDPVVALRTE